MSTTILRIAVPSPLNTLFDYLPPAESSQFFPGERFKIPFGRSEKIGVLIEIATTSTVPASKLRRASVQLDTTPLWSETLFQLISWSANYYHHPIGEVFATALPVALKQGKAADYRPEACWQLTQHGEAADPQRFKRAPKQGAILKLLSHHKEPLATSTIKCCVDNVAPALKRLQQLGLVEQGRRPAELLTIATAPHQLNEEQRHAVNTIIGCQGGFQTLLLDGITGSGKTEVYLQAMAPVLKAGRAVLVLVPEIGLTPQLVERFQERFSCSIGMLHSGLADGERLQNWLAARAGDIQLIIGTRSAVFTPFANLGMIIIDEEHDTSFKQQDGFRYSARDVAVKRAQLEQIPIVLGSATPSIETLHHAQAGHYHHLKLTKRAGEAQPPQIHLLDLRQLKLRDGLSQPLLNAIGKELTANNQVLIFLNRRGFAPALLCYDCGWSAKCHRCDALMTLYAGQQRLRCHHCGLEALAPSQCPECQSDNINPVGEGTERLEQALTNHFPDSEVMRIDRDTTRHKAAFEDLAERARDGRNQILLGTQMLAKGHHFPNVTLVGIINADGGIFSVDFRASERMVQQIYQVAGRAGRAEKPGNVIIQTHAPDHPLFQQIISGGYASCARELLHERKLSCLPPYSYLAMLRAEASEQEPALHFLEQMRQQGSTLDPSVMLLGPIPAPMPRRAGRYRTQLLVQATDRSALHRFLNQWVLLIEREKSGRKVRWSLDVDPIELY